MKATEQTKYSHLGTIVGLHIKFLNNQPGISKVSYSPLDFPSKRSLNLHAPLRRLFAVVLSSSLQWSMAMSTIAQQANRAMCVLRDVKYKCGQIPLSVSFELFDKMILPILLYGSEVWGYEFRKDIENVHVKFCRYILGVSSRAPTCAVLGEWCGRMPLYVMYIYRCVKYWIRIVQSLSFDRYPTRIYNMLFNLDSMGRTIGLLN